MRVTMLIGIAVVAWALVGTGPASAGSASWAVQANAVCKTQKAKTRVVRARLQKTVQPLVRHQPLTHAQWSYVLHTSLQLVRTCVDLLPTREALALTSAYDEGRTIYDLEWMGKNLTARGLPVRPGSTGINGLVVKRVYKLPGRKALEGSTAIGAQ